jgi:hypothetical protein
VAFEAQISGSIKFRLNVNPDCTTVQFESTEISILEEFQMAEFFRQGLKKRCDACFAQGFFGEVVEMDMGGSRTQTLHPFTLMPEYFGPVS